MAVSKFITKPLDGKTTCVNPVSHRAALVCTHNDRTSERANLYHTITALFTTRPSSRDLVFLCFYVFLMLVLVSARCRYCFPVCLFCLLVSCLFPARTVHCPRDRLVFLDNLESFFFLFYLDFDLIFFLSFPLSPSHGA